MARSPLEVADILRAVGDSATAIAGLTISAAQKRVLLALTACRTARLGGHVEHCDRCEHERIAYNLCRNRHCPKCQAAKRAQWFEARRRDLLPAIAADTKHLVARIGFVAVLHTWTQTLLHRGHRQ